MAAQAKTNPKAFYKYSNSKLKTRVGIGDLRKEDGTTTNSEAEKGEVLNKFFTSLFSREKSTQIPEFTNPEINKNHMS